MSNLYIHTYIYIHTYVRTYVHTYIHTYHCIALHCITLHSIALHCITLHYITLHTSYTHQQNETKRYARSATVQSLGKCPVQGVLPLERRNCGAPVASELGQLEEEQIAGEAGDSSYSCLGSGASCGSPAPHSHEVDIKITAASSGGVLR